MSMPFDATLKDLGADFPGDFLATFDQPPTLPVKPLNVDLSTVTTAADFVVGLGKPLAEVIHIDFQSSAMEGKHADVLVYSSLLYRLYRVPVHSIVILLRPAAAHSNLNGAIDYAPRTGRGRMNFGYEVVKLWERPVEQFLLGSLGTLPLAVLGRLPEGVELEAGLTAVAHRIIQRLEAEASGEQTLQLLTGALVLTGLLVPRNVAREIFAGVRAMRDSDTYMGLLEDRQGEARRLIIRLGQRFLGPPNEEARQRLEAIIDIDHLERIHDHAVDALSWQDLLDTP